MGLIRSIKYTFSKHGYLVFELILSLLFTVSNFGLYIASKVLLTVIPQWLMGLLLICAIFYLLVHSFNLWGYLRLPRHYFYHSHVKLRIAGLLTNVLILVLVVVCWLFEIFGYPLYVFG